MIASLKTGLKAPRPGAVKLKFGDYVRRSALPQRPPEFGHEKLIAQWHMLGNDKWGNCAWAGAAHETYLLTAIGSERSHITTANVLSDYAACTGFNPADPSTDQGTDMQMAAAYRRKVGIVDAQGLRHRIGAYADIKAGDLSDILTAAWLFGVCPIGVKIGPLQERQFDAGQPWDGDPGPNAGGHYVPVVARHAGLNYVVTWGKLHPVTNNFIAKYCDQALAILSPDMLKNGISIDGFKLADLQNDLAALTG